MMQSGNIWHPSGVVLLFSPVRGIQVLRSVAWDPKKGWQQPGYELFFGDSSAGDGDSDGGMIAPELFINGPGMKVLLDEECNKFID
jgi:hypothetical protein